MDGKISQKKDQSAIKMSKFYFIFLTFLLVSCNCKTLSIDEFLNTTEGAKVTLHEDADNIYFPDSEAFNTLRPLKNKDRIDVLDKISFNRFFRYFVKKNNVLYSQFILIESYRSVNS